MPVPVSVSIPEIVSRTVDRGSGLKLSSARVRVRVRVRVRNPIPNSGQEQWADAVGRRSGRQLSGCGAVQAAFSWHGPVNRCRLLQTKPRVIEIGGAENPEIAGQTSHHLAKGQPVQGFAASDRASLQFGSFPDESSGDDPNCRARTRADQSLRRLRRRFQAVIRSRNPWT
jgi:hypothetical protein